MLSPLIGANMPSLINQLPEPDVFRCQPEKSPVSNPPLTIGSPPSTLHSRVVVTGTLDARSGGRGLLGASGLSSSSTRMFPTPGMKPGALASREDTARIERVDEQLLVPRGKTDEEMAGEADPFHLQTHAARQEEVDEG